MATKNVSPEVELLPPTEIQRPELQDAIEALTKDALPLFQLRERARGVAQILPKEATPANYSDMGAILSEARIIKETPMNRLGAFFTIVQRVKSFLDTQSNKVKNACTEIESIALPWMKAFEQKELAETKKEQAKMPEGTEVKPNLPTVSGYRRTTRYLATFDTPADFDKMLKRFFTTKSRDERTYLRKFMTWDESALGKEARDLKDPKELMKKIPGCRAWSD